MSDQGTPRFDNPIQLFCGDSDSLDRMVSYLTYAGVDAQKEYNDDGSYALLVDAADRRRANCLLLPYLAEKKSRMEEQQRLLEESESAPYSHVYEKCDGRYRNYLSSAAVLAVAGTGILALLFLSEAGILRLPVSSRSHPFAFFLFCGAGLTFGAAAAVSFLRASRLHGMIADERSLTETLTSWFLSTYDRRQIDQSILAAEGPIDSEDLLHRKRLEQIGRYLTRENSHLDAAYTARLSEDLYPLIYGNGKGSC